MILRVPYELLSIGTPRPLPLFVTVSTLDCSPLCTEVSPPDVQRFAGHGISLQHLHCLWYGAVALARRRCPPHRYTEDSGPVQR